MTRLLPLCSLACASVFVANTAFAHAICGARVFAVPLTMDDPGVSDEASIPTFTYTRTGGGDEPGPVQEYNFNFELDKRITTNLGLAVNYGWSIFQTPHQQTQTGFQNLFVTAKYQTCVSPDHEFIFTVGLQREFGRTGTQHTGADQSGATAPTLYFGKGLARISHSIERVVALRGLSGLTDETAGMRSKPV